MSLVTQNPPTTAKSIPTPKSKAAIVDDAFDPILEGDVSIDEYLSFQQLVEEDSTFDVFLEKLDVSKPDFTQEDENSDAFLLYLNFLWDNRSNPDVGKLITDNLFNNKQGKVRDIDAICENLRVAGLEIVQIGSTNQDFSIFEDGTYVYVFLDYNLGPVEGTNAIKKAESTAREIYNTCPAEKKPVTILMSSSPNAERVKEEFRVKAGLLEGVFRYSNKENLKNVGKVSLLVRSYHQAFRSQHELQEYIQALSSAADTALKRFKEEIKVLRIDDYVFMQNSSLIDDEQPLGDYLAWLYGAHWANLLLQDKDLKEKQGNIDRIVSKVTPLHHEMPSNKLAEIYMNALFDNELSDVGPHPFRTVEIEQEGENENSVDYPYLHLGDVFSSPESRVIWMVINAQCDLERPKRDFADRSILLIPGELSPLEQQSVIPSPRTELFLLNDKAYRIAWKEKKVISMPYESVNKWRTDGNWGRNHRLKLPFALEVQQAFSTSVSRVGLPVSPPFTQTVGIQVAMGKHGKPPHILIEKSAKYAFLPVTRSNAEKRVKLTVDFALALRDALNNKIMELTLRMNLEKGDDKNVDYLVDMLSNLDYMVNNFDEWFLANTVGFKTPTAKFVELIPNYLKAGVNIDIESYPVDTPFFINIITAD